MRPARTPLTCRRGSSPQRTTPSRTSRSRWNRAYGQILPRWLLAFGLPLTRTCIGPARSRLGLLPALLHVYGHRWTLKELYAVWNEMPLVLTPCRRGPRDSMKTHVAKNRIRKLAQEGAAGVRTSPPRSQRPQGGLVGAPVTQPRERVGQVEGVGNREGHSTGPSITPKQRRCHTYGYPS